MMDVRYKRDLNSNYMIMTDAEKREEIYEDRMITENRIYGSFHVWNRRRKSRQSIFMRSPDDRAWNFSMNGERFLMNSLWNS